MPDTERTQRKQADVPPAAATKLYRLTINFIRCHMDTGQFEVRGSMIDESGTPLPGGYPHASWVNESGFFDSKEKFIQNLLHAAEAGSIATDDDGNPLVYWSDTARRFWEGGFDENTGRDWEGLRDRDWTPPAAPTAAMVSSIVPSAVPPVEHDNEVPF